LVQKFRWKEISMATIVGVKKLEGLSFIGISVVSWLFCFVTMYASTDGQIDRETVSISIPQTACACT